MFTEERQQQIVEIINKRSFISILELEKSFHVSNETIRRDLLALEGKKKLIRVHGGAMSLKASFAEKSFDVRQSENIEGKEELCRQAMAFVNEGDIIAIDSGSTAVFFCRLLTENFHSLTVVTNSLMLFNILTENPGFRLILCSGEYNRGEAFFCGQLTVESIRKLHISKAFLCPVGISLKHGLTGFSEEYIQIQQALKEAADKCFVIADSSKFEVGGLYSVLALKSDITVITDHFLNDEIYQKYIDADIDIVRG